VLFTINLRKHDFENLIFFSSHCSVKTDMLTSGAISRLYIANANRHDSGNYSCGKLTFLTALELADIFNSSSS
jgi:hypothetical protein